MLTYCILIAAAPVVLYLILLILLDSFSIIKKTQLLLAFIWGAFLCFLMSLIHPYITSYAWLICILEEVLKFTLVGIFIHKGKSAFFSDTAIYAATIGAGFALTGSICHIAVQKVDISAAMLLGEVTSSVMHMGLTAISAILFYTISNKNITKIVANKQLLYAEIALLPSIILHILYHQFELTPVWMFVIVLVVISYIFLRILSYNDSIIDDWLENTTFNESALISAIRKGQFANTPEGNYLSSIKEQFNPEVYFDIIMYVELYLELSLHAKRNLMLREAELPVPDEKEAFKAKKQELKSLKKKIGKIGIYTISPIINKKESDKLIDLYL